MVTTSPQAPWTPSQNEAPIPWGVVSTPEPFPRNRFAPPPP